MKDEDKPVPFIGDKRVEGVYQKEWEEIRERRRRQFYSSNRFDDDTSKPPRNLVGLALSGGGIRSATFCLGFLQGMHKLKLLRIFDYLSTVSGGGYVGGWWSAWLARDEINPQADDNCTLEFEVEDIRNPASLAARLRGSGDEVSVKLQERFSPEMQQLLADFKDRGEPSKELLEAMVEVLNDAVKGDFLAKPSRAESNEDDDEGKSVEGKLKREKKAQCINRLILERAYPYELRDIFPPREKIASERPAHAPHEIHGREAEGSISAWKDPIHHLRLFASYLTPRRGMLSADTWRAISVLTRNLVLTWLILLPLLVMIVLAGQLYFQMIDKLIPAIDLQRVAVAFIEAPIPGDLIASADPTLSDINLNVDYRPALQNRLLYIAVPALGLIGWIVMLTVMWLFYSRDRISVNGVIIHLVCLSAVGALLISGLPSHVLTNWVGDMSSKWYVIGGITLWLIILIILLIAALRPPKLMDLPTDSSETISMWKRQVKRNRISRIHTILMIILAVMTVVLLLAGFGHLLIESVHFPHVQLPVILVPALTALFGSIFTAFKASPKGGGDKFEMREPSVFSRLIFAVTPGLMVIVLAIAAAWLGEELLKHILMEGALGNVNLLLTVAIFYGIVLCFALAVYEMKWPRELEGTWPLLAFSFLVLLNFLLALKAIIVFSDSKKISPALTFLLCSALGLILLIAFVRIFGYGRWRRMIKTVKRNWQRPAAIIGSTVFVLLFVLFMRSLPATLDERDRFAPGVSNLMIIAAVLTGSMILFRLLTVRSKGKSSSFKVKKFFKGRSLSQRPEAIWWLASMCLMIPVIVGCLLHLGFSREDEPFRWAHILVMFVLVLLVGILPYLLILFRISAVGVKEKKGKHVKQDDPAKQVKPGLLEKIVKKLPWVSESKAENAKPEVFRALACVGIGFALTAGFVIRSGGTGQTQQESWLPLDSPAFIIGMILSLILFQFSVMHMPIKESGTIYKYKWIDRKWIEKHSHAFLWVLGIFCVLIAFFMGYLSSVGLFHHTGATSDHHILTRLAASDMLSNVALAGLLICFTLTVFEVGWGEGDNRRSLWLLASVYLVISALFVIGLISDFREKPAIMGLLTVFGLLAATLVWVVALGWMVDPNVVSMHQFYKGRLVRAYLGASNARRHDQGKDITETVAGDDIPLAALKNCQRGAPYHLINTTLNLVAGRDLSTAQRSASTFVLSQNYCGSSRTLYRPTKEYMDGRLTLGTAVAASGAAVSPNMGAKKPTAALAMLMTLLNVRLGYWAPTPNRENWIMSQPRLWPFYLLREFLSQTNDVSSYCYLTDGGHFDNTGLYSLVERGCRYIVLVDCAADPQPCFQDLGDAIRRCRIDFGTEIKLDIEPFLKNRRNSKQQYFIVGGIRYSRKHAESLRWNLEGKENSKEDKDARTGIIIYIKPSIVGKETADVRQYAIENKHFPQQTTANQWFDEAQFESYRRLGQICAKQAFGELDACQRLNEKVGLSPEQIEDIFVDADKNFNPKKGSSKQSSD